MINKITLLHLSLIEGIGPAALQVIIDKKTDAWRWVDLYHMSRGEFKTIFGFSDEKSQKLIDGLADQRRLEQELKYIEKFQINFITIFDDEYPDLLKHIHLPPPVLYIQGASLRSMEKCLAVVGSRAMNWYGEKAIELLIPSLVKSKFCIVSGGAIGVDSYAHSVVLDRGGKAIVVLGSGLLKPYPASNRRFFEKIRDMDGTIISPFPLNVSARAGHFPARNRIIAGLSLGCLVVQAAEKSGAGITARFALEQGRDVFAVPGSVDDALSVGCHKLIQDGAKLVYSPDDILEEYGMIQPDRMKANESFSTRRPADSSCEVILSYCSTPITIDELAQKTGIEMQKLHEQLFDMQIQGIVTQQMGLWRRC